MITQDQLDDIFARGGLLERSIPHYEKRDEQLMMASDSAVCFNEDRIGVIEAGTGIGKSFAYLAVALLESLSSPQGRTVVATSNVALQQQLINKDLPSLEKAMGVDVPYALLLGRGRYVCMSKILNAVNGERMQAGLFKDDESDAERVYSWFRSTKTGIVEELDFRLLSSSFVQAVRSDKDSCLKQRCPYFQKCFYYQAIQRAKKSRLVVTNHALLFIDSSVRAELDTGFDEDVVLPLFNRLIIDECHNIDKSATEFFSIELGKEELNDVFRKLFQVTYTVNGRQTLANIITGFRDDVTVEDARAFYTDMTLFCGDCARFLSGLVSAADRRKYSTQCLIDDTETDFDSVQRPRAEALLVVLDRIVGMMGHFLSLPVAEEMDIYKRMAGTLLERLSGWQHLLRMFLDHGSHDELVFYYSYAKNSSDVTMVLSPISVGAMLRANIFDKLDSVICTSATIKAGKDFSYFLRQVGLEGRDDLVTGFYASPFDYSRNAMLLYPAAGDGMKFNIAVRQSYADYLADMLVSVIDRSEGSALVLFTSMEMLNMVHERISGRIRQELLVQKKGSSTEQLRSRFREDVSSVLLGLRTFWEGIDVPGEALKVLVITQLPYVHVEDPVKRARSVRIAREGGNPFMQIDVPEMLISLKQGLGRLIRSASDRGVAIIADGRTARYIELIRACIPPYYVPESENLTVASFPDRVEDFLYS